MIVAVIPTFNEESTMSQVVYGASKHVDSVLVIDNNSSDRSANIAKECGAIVHSQPTQGVGAAIRTGWHYAEVAQADIVVTLDGDGQHNPREIPVVVKSILMNQADMVIGSRFINNQHIPRYRRFGIKVINWLVNVGHKTKFLDTQSGFRAYNKKALFWISIEDNGFAYSTEVLLRARKAELRIAEVPVGCVYHEDRRQDNTMNPIKHGLIVAFKTVMWRIKLWA